MLAAGKVGEVMRKRGFEWEREFSLAKETLWGEPGRLEIATDQYVAFRYIEPNLRLVFYPHKTSAGNYHLRIRYEGCKDNLRADLLAKRLDDAAGFNCTFQRKNA